MSRTATFFSLLLLIPILFDGRIRPLETLPEESAITVPQTDHSWVAIDEVTTPLYSPDVIAKAKHNPSLLQEAYRTIAGRPYLKTYTRTLYYPSLFKLHLELFLHRVPFVWIAIALYLLALWRSLSFYLAFCVHTFLLVARIYILGRPPVSNMFESLLFVPWVAAAISPFFGTLRPAALLSALLLFLLPPRLKFENVQAVLDSNWWLATHVLMVVGSYALFLLSALLGHIALIRPKEVLTTSLLKLLYLGTALLICGTILGGVWALNSWGRFWDWDPKESWAFISSGLYLILIHAYKFGVIKARGLAAGAIIGAMAIAFTWYGVNYILGTGLHSYGFGEGNATFFYLYLALESAFIIAVLKFPFAKKREALQIKAQKGKTSPFQLWAKRADGYSDEERTSKKA